MSVDVIDLSLDVLTGCDFSISVLTLSDFMVQVKLDSDLEIELTPLVEFMEEL